MGWGNEFINTFIVQTKNIYHNFNFNSTKMETLRSDNAKEVLALQDQAKRLQVQLNNGFTAFAEYKSKKSAEILLLESQLKDSNATVVLDETSGDSALNKTNESHLAQKCSELEVKLESEKTTSADFKTQCLALQNENGELQKQVCFLI